jgi:hypothetical protein
MNFKLLAFLLTIKKYDKPKQVYEYFVEQKVGWKLAKDIATIFYSLFKRGDIIWGEAQWPWCVSVCKHFVWRDNDGTIYDPVNIFIGNTDEWVRKFGVISGGVDNANDRESTA